MVFLLSTYKLFVIFYTFCLFLFNLILFVIYMRTLVYLFFFIFIEIITHDDDDGICILDKFYFEQSIKHC